MLGDVMRESAQAALTYVRVERRARLGIDPAASFEGKAVHVHVPAGARPEGRAVGRRDDR